MVQHSGLPHSGGFLHIFKHPDCGFADVLAPARCIAGQRDSEKPCFGRPQDHFKGMRRWSFAEISTLMFASQYSADSLECFESDVLPC